MWQTVCNYPSLYWVNIIRLQTNNKLYNLRKTGLSKKAYMVVMKMMKGWKNSNE